MMITRFFFVIAMETVFFLSYCYAEEGIDGKKLLLEALDASPRGTFQAEGFYIDNLDRTVQYDAVPEEYLSRLGYSERVIHQESVKYTEKIAQLTTSDGTVYRRVDAKEIGRYPSISIQNAEGLFFQNSRKETSLANWVWNLGTWNELYFHPVKQEMEDASYEVERITKYHLPCYQITMTLPDDYAWHYSQHRDNWKELPENLKYNAYLRDKPSPAIFPVKRVFIVVESTKQIVMRKHYNTEGVLTLHYEFTKYTPDAPDMSLFETPGPVSCREDFPGYAAALAYREEAAADEAAKKSQESKDRMNARWNQYFRNITSGGWVIIMIVSVLCIGGGLAMKKIRDRK